MDIKQRQKNLKRDWKNDLVNIILSLGVAFIAYYTFNHFKPGVEDMFASVIFFLVLILLEVGCKK